ncbi:MAG TPA: cysteine desulfurase family protein [Micropepsaceae bacterium]|nr:cysteine desulfurase family protein [Micropepsaceae bacterium]
MVYLDHNATSPLRASARLAVESALTAYGNASSVHAAGRSARARIEEAREAVASLAGTTAACAVFTSGGSEANALALRGAIAGAAQEEDRIARLFVSTIEHESVRANASALAEAVPGLKLTEIPVTGQGTIDLGALRLKLIQGKGRVLVSIMAANNETGVLQDIHGIAKLVRSEGGAGALFHIDAVQAAGRTALSFDAWGADYMTLSAHKLGGPQGAGALLVRDGAPLSPQIAGGGQEMRRRSGTENVAAIAGFGAAAAELAGLADAIATVRALRDRFEAELARAVPELIIFGASAERLANTSNFAIPGLAAETALIALDLDGVAVSSGSACSSGKVKPSHVLAAMGVDEGLARCGIRVSFGWTNSDSDVDAVIQSLRRLIARRTALAA